MKKTNIDIESSGEMLKKEASPRKWVSFFLNLFVRMIFKSDTETELVVGARNEKG